MNKWEDLTLSEKSEMMRVAVENGITNLPDIKQAYNEFAEGGAVSETQPTENIFGKGGKKDNNSKSVFLNSLEQSLREDSRFNSNEWRKFFTDLAEKESSYSPDITNSIGAKGYFQLMPFNRAKAWTSPTQQFHEMYKLTGNNLKYLQKNLTEKDWEWANKRGIDMYGMLAGAHLGGVGNVVNAIRGKGNAKDMNGSSVIGYMTKFSQNSPTRDIKLHSPYKLPEQEIPFIPWNEKAFYTPLTAYQPVVLPDEQQPIVREALAYDPKEIERQERQRGLNNFMTLMSMTSPQESGNPYLDTIGMLAGNQFKKGGKIYIKPNNRGKFIKLKERTGHSATWFKEHGTPAQKKMATFALNSRHWKHGLGGNLFDGTTEDSQQMSRPNIYRYNDGRYVYQVAPDAEEIEVSPINTLLPNPSQWTYQDAEGKVYTPHAAQVDTGSITQNEDTNPLLRAANNYMREAAYRAKDGTLALQGKYTMPAIAASALLPLAGEAFAGSTIAGVPATTWANTAMTAGFAGHGLNHVINEGIDGWGDAAMTALELAPLGRLFKPAFEIGYHTAKPIFDKAATSLQNNYPALFDPYTSWDATFGYHGDNIFSRAIGTIGRRYGYTPKAEVPEFHRRLAITKPESFRLTDDGKFIMSSGRTGEGHEGIVNFATSEAARSHNKHKYLSGIDDFIVHPKALENANWKSIQPSDTFLELPLDNSTLAIDPKYITFVSGEPEALNYARSIGMKTLSSPKLRALEADKPSFSGLLSRINNWKGAHSDNARNIGNEIQRLTSMRGAPTMKDYAYFENATGLNSGVVPSSQWTGINEEALFGRSSGVRGIPKFNNVAYDPATPIESIYRKAKTGEIPWSDYYEALEKMPSARQQLGLTIDNTAPQITAENAASTQRQIGETAPSGSIEETANAVERGRNALLDWIRSPFYKARLEDEPLYRVSNDVVADAGKMIEEVPIDISKTKLELDPSGMVNGVTKTRPAIQTQLPDGTILADLNTGLDVNVASDLGKDADETALHELLHYMTANSKGTPISKAGERIIEKGWMSPTETHFDAINIIHKNRGKGWQDYILDQNNALLPQYDPIVKMVMEEPDKAISFLEKAGKSTQEAKNAIQSLKARYSEWYDIQEQRTYLQQLFHSKIKSNLKNPNDAAEIEEYLSSHPEVLENFPAYRHIQEVRPGSIKDYAKYFSAALGTTPFILKPSKDE